MKRIINVFSIIAIVAGIVLGTTGAYFTDTEISPTNTFAAGTLELSTDGTYTTMPIEVTNIKPGDTGTGVIRLENSGTMTGEIQAATINMVEDNENDCNSPEALVDASCGDPGVGEGELDEYLEIILWVDANDDDLLSTSTEVYFVSSGSLDINNGTTTPPSSALNLTAGQNVDVKLLWQADPNHLGGNIFQSDSTAFSITFDFRQI